MASNSGEVDSFGDVGVTSAVLETDSLEAISVGADVFGTDVVGVADEQPAKMNSMVVNASVNSIFLMIFIPY